MENIEIFSDNYKEKTFQIIKSNLQYVIVGAFVMSFVFAYVSAQYLNTHTVSDKVLGRNIPKEDIEQAPVVIDIQKRLQNKMITYVTPKPTIDGMKLSAPKQKENGQISAIATSQVTYTKNKYIVQTGDSLASIALQVYGDSNAWVRLAEANDLTSPDQIEVGMELTIPR